MYHIQASGLCLHVKRHKVYVKQLMLCRYNTHNIYNPVKLRLSE